MKKFINNLQILNYIDIFQMLDDNIFGIKMTKIDKFYKQIKPIDIQQYFISKLVEQNKIFIDYFNIKMMLANNFNKALEKRKFENN